MKRIVEIIMSAFLTFILAACTGTASNQTEKNEQKGEQNSAPAAETDETKPSEGAKAKLLYMGHASLRITTAEGKAWMPLSTRRGERKSFRIQGVVPASPSIFSIICRFWR